MLDSWRVAVAVSAGYLVLLAVLARRVDRRPAPPAQLRPHRHYVLLVPARNEGLVLSDTLESLCRVPGGRTTIVVVDDGSSDDTAAIASRFAERGVHLVRRLAPHAGKGKGAALNAGYQYACRLALGRRDELVIGVIDADGRLDPAALDHVDEALADPAVGGVQLAVRIEQRSRLLVRYQDFEFVTFSHLFQAARHRLGSVGLGGNGQFTRLSALQSLGTAPWSDCLSEDLDIGLRLIIEGWKLGFVGTAAVHQEGVETLRALVRQRSRWVHGHLQCWKRIPALVRSGLPRKSVADTLVYLGSPAMLAGLSLGVIATACFEALTLVGVALPGPGAPWRTPGELLVWWFPVAVPLVLLATTYRRHRGGVSWPAACALSLGLILYNLVWYVALWRAVADIAAGERSWIKTERRAATRRSPPAPSPPFARTLQTRADHCAIDSLEALR